MTTLTRETLQPLTVDWSKESEELAEKAANLLGYHAVKTHLQIEKVNTDAQIVDTIRELQIQPYANRSVEKYKNKVIRKYTFKNIPYYCLNGVQAAFFATLAAAIISGIANIWLSLGYTWAWFGLAAVVCLATVLISENFVLKWKAVWDFIPISEYDNVIPEFALQTAVDLKEKCPSVNLFIEELDIDPFLVAKLSSGQRIYLEVWNEPKFRK